MSQTYFVINKITTCLLANKGRLLFVKWSFMTTIPLLANSLF